MELLGFLCIQARANRLANHRLHAAMAPLSREEFHAPRTSFFPSLAATLNHILEVDLYYIAALHGEADMAQRWKDFVPSDTMAELAAAQARSDQRFIALMDALSAEHLDEVIDLVRTHHVQRERRGHVIAHLLNHQVHHRGQAHAMLAGTSVRPPQLDEFLMPSEAHLRVADMAATGWTEGDLFG
ncbi:DinB family protein [Piscinibacter sp. XHJ-5]|uniref:DinB family protein n=1 Tax=Piscinibacter sp. XHJ-5 TaxID=3037797 RepID=UPI002452EEC8|nr:DinB family protein [Piscinibacter sp. XHJ-5]